jgi:hypothetical protein
MELEPHGPVRPAEAKPFLDSLPDQAVGLVSFIEQRLDASPP